MQCPKFSFYFKFKDVADLRMEGFSCKQNLHTLSPGANGFTFLTTSLLMLMLMLLFFISIEMVTTYLPIYHSISYFPYLPLSVSLSESLFLPFPPLLVMFSYVLSIFSERGQPVCSDSTEQKASVGTSSTQSTFPSDRKDTGDTKYIPFDSLEDFDTHASQTQKFSDGKKLWNGTTRAPIPSDEWTRTMEQNRKLYTS